MQSAQHTPKARCPVYHTRQRPPAHATAEVIQARTGLLVIISTSQRALPLNQPRPCRPQHGCRQRPVGRCCMNKPTIEELPLQISHLPADRQPGQVEGHLLSVLHRRGRLRFNPPPTTPRR